MSGPWADALGRINTILFHRSVIDLSLSVAAMPNPLVRNVSMSRRGFIDKGPASLSPACDRPALPVRPRRSRSLIRPNC